MLIPAGLINLIYNSIKEPNHKRIVLLTLSCMAATSLYIYIAIYLFSPIFFEKSLTWMPIAISVALGIIYYLMVLLTVDTSSVIMAKITPEIDFRLIYKILIAGAFSIFYLSAYMVVAYMLNQLILIDGWVTFPRFCYVLYAMQLANVAIGLTAGSGSKLKPELRDKKESIK